jgi:uncharacterized membrane protein YbhN (UPF0104 family)
MISLLLLGLYLVMFGVLVMILSASMRMCRKAVGGRENMLLNAHSLFINFFIPGQGGPFYRGTYLYKKYKLKIRTYIIVTLLYYAFYAVISVFLVLLDTRPWWQTALVVLATAGFSLFVIRRYLRKHHAKLDELGLNLGYRAVAYLFLATLLQAVLQLIIYAIELHTVNKHIVLSQVVTYTGVANLALFVALTPGAIGIRESFLIFSERLHHISSANIIVANVIDHSVYLIFLLLLLIVTVTIHLKWKKYLSRLPFIRAYFKV